METFPVAPELMQAFPLGALNLLVAVASTVAAQHGAGPARRLFSELANNDEVWTYIAARLGRPAPSDDAPDSQHGAPTTSDSSEVPIAAQAPAAPDGEPVAAAASRKTGAASHGVDERPALAPQASASDPVVARVEFGGGLVPAPPRSRNSRRRHKKTNGSG
jgi:hypothetical protein